MSSKPVDSKKEEDDDEDIKYVNSDIPIVLVSGEGIAAPTSKGGKIAGFVTLSFYFNPPEAKEHTHVVHSRVAMEWEQAERFANGLLDYIKKNKPK